MTQTEMPLSVECLILDCNINVDVKYLDA